MSFKNDLTSNLGNMPGWRTSRKIVVIESDDWGCSGTPSRKAFNSLQAKGILPGQDSMRFPEFDTLESETDLSMLYETLRSVRDSKGNYAAITALCVMANPDFERIEESGFRNYYVEPLSATAKKIKGSEGLLELWKSGNKEGLFVPQFHGREHLNVTAWMKALKSGQPKTMLAFHERVYGIDPVILGESKIQYRAAFDIWSLEELDILKEVITEGIHLFKDMLGFHPVFFVPSNGPFNLGLEATLIELGIRYLTLDKLQKEPMGNGKFRSRIRYIGKRNRDGLIYLSRNAVFEPSLEGSDHVDQCLAGIRMAFRWRKPATISTHRVNYVGSLDESNRANGIQLLGELLQKIVSVWPDVEFMTSDQLGKLIRKNDK